MSLDTRDVRLMSLGAKYSYDITTDFLNQKVNVRKLSIEIEDSNIPNELDSVHTDGDNCDIWFSTSLSAGSQSTLSALVSAHDGNPVPNPIQNFLDENATVTVTTPASSFSGDFDIMQVLVNRREIFNDKDNPIYDSTLTPIVGSAGHLQDHADRILNLENIHAKTGWHRQEVKKASYEKPDNLLIYYGWMNSFNSSANSWTNEKVAQDMARYNIVVLGDGIQDPSHGDYSNTSVIIPRIKALNPSTKIFGYVTLNQTLANFKSKVDDWDDLEVHGIFMDESGYDYGTVATNGRSAFNVKVDYVHGKTDSNLCFINAWNMDHIIGTTNDTSYPNSTWNVGLSASNLTENDYYLLESFAVNTLSYGTDYETKSSWSSRGSKAIGHRYTYGINLVGSCVIQDGHASRRNLIDFAFISSMMFSLDAFGSSDHNYGASSAKSKFFSYPDVSSMGEVYALSPTVIVDSGDSDVYHRYVPFGKLSLDFSSSAQTSTIEKY
jgi:hypothetical protein